MNDGAMLQAARERLLTIELAQVAGDAGASAHGIAVRRPTPRGRWLAAAIALLGALVAFGVAWLRAHDAAPAQQPAFDVIEPEFERDMQLFWSTRVGSREG